MPRHSSWVAIAFAGLTVSATVGGCGSDETDFGAGGSGAQVEKELDPAPGGVRRILARQYVNSVELLFGEAAAAAANPPEDIALHGFSTIGAAQLAMPEADVETYESSARAVGEALVADQPALDAVMPCTPQGSDARACYEQLVAEVGRVAWRRPLTDAEVADIADIAVQAHQEYGEWRQGVLYVVMTLLQAPEFLYIVEVGEPDPEAEGRRHLTPTEIATRLSFFLTDTTPSAELLDAAEAGELSDPERLREVARELLSEPDAEEAVRGFFTEIYRLERLEGTAKDAELFPGWNEQLAADMKESALMLIDDFVWNDVDARELMTADYAYVNDRLASTYDVEASGGDFQKMSLPAEQGRAGIMGQAGMHALLSHVDKTSATKRGVFIRRVLMCDSVPPPDPEVMLELPEADENDPKTMKELLEMHQEDPACASCHQLFDPVGLAYEQFDAVGEHRTEDLGLPIDPSGDQPGLGEFDGPAEVGQLLHDSEKVPSCYVRSVYRHATGHLEDDGEEVAIEAIETAFAEGGYRFQDLLVEVVASPAFRIVGDPK